MAQNLVVQLKILAEAIAAHNSDGQKVTVTEATKIWPTEEAYVVKAVLGDDPNDRNREQGFAVTLNNNTVTAVMPVATPTPMVGWTLVLKEKSGE